MAVPSKTLKLRDGRTLSYADYGPPIIYMHGFPGSRLEAALLTRFTTTTARIIAPDRPGMGALDLPARPPPPRLARRHPRAGRPPAARADVNIPVAMMEKAADKLAGSVRTVFAEETHMSTPGESWRGDTTATARVGASGTDVSVK